MNRPTILIIEDNPISRKFLRITLESENYKVIEASDGTSALVVAMQQKLDLIIQDLFLPDMDGMVLSQKLRAIPKINKIPIFALSGFLSQVDNQVKSSGFTTFLLKPIDPSYLLDVVKAHLPISLPSKNQVGKSKHILIADDNSIQLKLFSMQLRNVGFEVTTAIDGLSALEQAKKIRPDVIISDILMPKLDGFGLCAEVKRNPDLHHIPVVLLTSHYLEDDDLALAKNVGASSYMTRTPDFEKFIDELLQILRAEPPEYSNMPLELTDDIKEKHTIRSIRQLEQQVLDNTKLAQRGAMLMSQLALIGGIVKGLTTSTLDIDESLKEVLYFTLDSIGISKGALYLKKSNKMLLCQYLGYTEDQKEKVENFFGISSLIADIIEKNEPFAIPSEDFSDMIAQNFLVEANVKSALLVPMFSGKECQGILFLGSDLTDLSNQDTKEVIATLGLQFGQSIALASVFKKLGSSEKRYRQLVEISPDAIFIQQGAKFAYANSSALKMLGAKNLSELDIRSCFDYFLVESKEVIKEYIQNDKKEISNLLFEGKLINLKSEVLDVEIVVSPFMYREKPALYMILRDITERKRSALHLEIQYAIAWILAESDTLFVATARILKIICERLEWDYGAIWAVNHKLNVLRCTRVWQTPEIQNNEFMQESQNSSFSKGVGLLGKVWIKRKALWIPNLKKIDFVRKHLAKKIGFQTAVLFPIIYENEVLGAIEFFSRRLLKPDQNLLLWLESIGNQFGVFLKRKHMENQLLYLAEHDVLTGLSNRILLEQYLTTALAKAKESNQKIAILFLDLDHFKYVNDSMGHQAGDLLLKEISERLNSCLRPQDTISRLGGDEFIIILPNIHQKEDVIEIISRLQSQVSTHININNKEFYMTASIGVSLFPENGHNVPTLIKCADIAMYAAKNKGRNTFQFCTEEMTTEAENRGALQEALIKGLENDEFILYYQPKIDVPSQKVTGMEALIRWKRPEGILLPSKFISAAEDSDIIIPIGEWALKTAWTQNKIWQEAGLPVVTVSVNLSVRNLTRQLLEIVDKTIRELDLKPNSIEVELTESMLMENVENNILILCGLKDLGVKISIDDFGTGYSSLSYLKRFPIDTIKIDQSFVRNIDTAPDEAAIVIAIIAMAHSLNFKVIAEGVETEAQLKFLCENGCDEIQGFYFSRPLSTDEATLFIKNSNKGWSFHQ